MPGKFDHKKVSQYIKLYDIKVSFDNLLSLFSCSLWELMDAEYSQICEQAVPILLHCVTLPVGADMFWKQIQEEFESPDWRRRFTAGKCSSLYRVV